MAEHKIAEKDMIRLVEEVSKLDSERQQMLDKSQVSRILNELSLPSELLDEALIRLSGKKKNERARKLAFLTVISLVLIGAIVAVVISMTAANVESSYSKIVASDARIMKNVEGTIPLSVVTPGELAVVHFTLHGVPQGVQLPLHAKWYKPDGTVFHENNWTTRKTTSSTWDSHAKCSIPESGPSGKWMVEISIGGRTVISKVFIVK